MNSSSGNSSSSKTREVVVVLTLNGGRCAHQVKGLFFSFLNSITTVDLLRLEASGGETVWGYLMIISSGMSPSVQRCSRGSGARSWDITCRFGLLIFGARERGGMVQGSRHDTPSCRCFDLSSANFLSPQTFRELSTVSFQLCFTPSSLEEEVRVRSLSHGAYGFTHWTHSFLVAGGASQHLDDP